MISVNVKLRTMEDVRDFCNILSAYPFEAHLCSGNDCVDAKSVLGIFSLNLERDTILRVLHESLLDLPEKIYKYMQ